MNHLTDERLISYLDGELAGSDRDAVARHLATCPECESALDELRLASRHLAEGLESMDRPAPAVDPARILELHGSRDRRESADRPGLGERPELADGSEGAERGEAAEDAAPGDRGEAAGVLPLPPSAPDLAPRAADSDRPSARTAGRGPSRRTLAAAAMLLIVVAGAAAAIPGSPVREWMVSTYRAVTAGAEGSSQQDDAPVVAASAERDAGVAVEPEAGSITVRFVDTSPGAVIRVRIVDDARASVRARDAAYRTSRGRIEVVGAGAGDVWVEIPRASTSARVEMEGRPLLEKRDEDVRVLDPTAESTGSEFIFRIDG